MNRFAKYYIAKRAAGQCARCRAPSFVFALCAICRAKQKVYAQARDANLRRAHLCVDCAEPAGEKSRCSACAQKASLLTSLRSNSTPANLLLTETFARSASRTDVREPPAVVALPTGGFFAPGAGGDA